MKILVVDDEEDVREIITDFIVENFDIDVLQAATGMEAINCLEGEKDIGLIIADYNFPELGDGGVNGGAGSGGVNGSWWSEWWIVVE